MTRFRLRLLLGRWSYIILLLVKYTVKSYGLAVSGLRLRLCFMFKLRLS